MNPLNPNRQMEEKHGSNRDILRRFAEKDYHHFRISWLPSRRLIPSIVFSLLYTSYLCAAVTRAAQSPRQSVTRRQLGQHGAPAPCNLSPIFDHPYPPLCAWEPAFQLRNRTSKNVELSYARPRRSSPRGTGPQAGPAVKSLVASSGVDR